MSAFSLHDLAATVIRYSGPLPMIKLNALVFIAAATTGANTEDAIARVSGPVFPSLQKLRPGTTHVGSWEAGSTHAMTQTHHNEIRDIVVRHRKVSALSCGGLFTTHAAFRAAIGSTINPRALHGAFAPQTNAKQEAFS